MKYAGLEFIAKDSVEKSPREKRKGNRVSGSGHLDSVNCLESADEYKKIEINVQAFMISNHRV